MVLVLWLMLCAAALLSICLAIYNEGLYEQYWIHKEQVNILYFLNTTVHEVLRFSLAVILRIFFYR